MADSRETQFQQDIIAAMTAGGEWVTGQASGYDRTNALYTEDLLAFFREAYPQRWDKLCKDNPQDPESALIRAVVRGLEKQGTLEVLRHGVKVPGVAIATCAFKPDHGMNPDAAARYAANRLRVVPDEEIPEEVTETSSRLNPGLKGRDLAEAFDTDEYNVMIAANKFQTGFDQPKLCAMYVDKKLQGVDCVQTLSRLNRTFPGKQTFVLDLYNDPEDILEAFRPYYNKAELADVSDANVVYNLQQSLDAEGIYHWDEVEAFARAFFDPKGAASKLSYYCKPAHARYTTRYKAAVAEIQALEAKKHEAERAGDQSGARRFAQELEEAGKARDALDLFKKNLASFVRTYEFLSQIVSYEDRKLEQLCVFAKHLHPLLRTQTPEGEEIDLSELQLTHYRLTKRAEHQLQLGEEHGEYGLKPVSDVGSGKPYDPEKKRLSEIIEKLNELFGAEVSDADKLQYANGIADRIERDEAVMAQLKSHSPQQVMHGLFPKRVTDTVLDAMQDHQKLSMEVLENNVTEKEFQWLILRLLADRISGSQPGIQPGSQP